MVAVTVLAGYRVGANRPFKGRFDTIGLVQVKGTLKRVQSFEIVPEGSPVLDSAPELVLLDVPFLLEIPGQDQPVHGLQCEAETHVGHVPAATARQKPPLNQKRFWRAPFGRAWTFRDRRSRRW